MSDENATSSFDEKIYRPLEQWMRVPAWLESVGLNDVFLAAFLNQSDWAMVIQWHALLEIAAAEFLTAHFGQQDLENAFSELPMGNFRYGKVIFLKECGVITKRQFRFLQLVTKMRNELAHDIRKLSFSIDADLEALPHKDRKVRHEEYAFWMWESANKAPTSSTLPAPRFCIHAGCYQILYTLSAQSRDIKLGVLAAAKAVATLDKLYPVQDRSIPTEQ